MVLLYKKGKVFDAVEVLRLGYLLFLYLRHGVTNMHSPEPQVLVKPTDSH